MSTSLLTTQEQELLLEKIAETNLRVTAFQQHARQLNAMLCALIESTSVVGQMAVESFQEQATLCVSAGIDGGALFQQLVPPLIAWQTANNVPGMFGPGYP